MRLRTDRRSRAQRRSSSPRQSASSARCSTSASHRSAPFLTVLAPVPLVFLALFLFDSDASKLVFVKTPHVAEQHVRSRTPVVLVVFDEFAPVSLMDADEQVDAARYPNFAALARDSTWFRNATTVQWLTEQAVPAVLTGIQPPMKHNLLPIYADHPHNVFTLLGKSYRVRAIESITQLCPHSICKNDRGSLRPRPSPTRRARSPPTPGSSTCTCCCRARTRTDPGDRRQLGRLRPARRRRRRSHAAAGARSEAVRKEHLPLRVADHRRRQADALRPATRSCRTCRTCTCPPAGATACRRRRSPAYHNVSQGAWPAEPGATSASCSRSSTPTARSGLLRRRLKAKGIYDRALVIVTADHGVSYRTGGPRRKPTPGNLQDIAFVPLFVKLPHQHAGRDRRRARADDRHRPDDRDACSAPGSLARRRKPLVGRRLGSRRHGRGSAGRTGTRSPARLSDAARRRHQALARGSDLDFGTTPELDLSDRPGPDLSGSRSPSSPSSRTRPPGSS